MQLKQLKLAGFKSFVDPTIIPFPSRLVAVVGPNGCGKSNIIDAVRWVMGESSAKNLRGESMADVIFNGSSQRKAVGQASIEVIFDNSLGRFAGQYANYQEIAVKRLVTRDGESSYFLNGSRCRRRDITDIFLGTGAGARGYSIIGQGTISRIIEARPEELRAYFEEAAGISKYKERRRETLARIEQTRENLARVADIREELDKQLQRLERQAKAAERYRSLKTQERRCKAEILALKWRLLKKEQQEKQNELQRWLVDYEKHQATAADAYKLSTELREKQHEENETFQQAQAKFYQLAAEIARLEEGMQQQQREKQQLAADQQQMRADCQEAYSRVEEDQQALGVSEFSLLNLQANLQALQTDYELKQKLSQERQREQPEWNQKLQQIQAALNKALRDVQAEQLRLQHLGEQRQQILTRLDKIKEEQSRVVIETLSEDLQILHASQADLQAKLQKEEAQYEQSVKTNALIRQQFGETEKHLHQIQDELHRLNTQQARLDAAQQAALGRETPEGENLNLEKWNDKPRLVEAITVEKNWQFACEFVLAEGLQSIVLESLDLLWPELHQLKASAAKFSSLSPVGENKRDYPRLVDKIQGSKPNWLFYFDKIYVASSLKQALDCLVNLDKDESVITEDGYWLAREWVKIAGKTVPDAVSLFERQEELSTIKEALTTGAAELSLLKNKRDSLHAQVNDNERALALAQQRLSIRRDDLRGCEAELSSKEVAFRQNEARQKTLREESEELLLNLESLAEQQVATEQIYIKAKESAQNKELEQSKLINEKAVWDENLQQASLVLDESRWALHQGQLHVDREKLKILQLKENLEREQARLGVLNERLETLTSRLLEFETPDRTLQEALNTKLTLHAEFEQGLSLSREELNSLTTRLESLESLIRSEEHFAKAVQVKIQHEQVQEQTLAVRAAAVLETMAELDCQIDTVLAAIPAERTQARGEQELEELVDKIKRLGAINLAAIEEYDIEFQRKQHLDEQYDDLTEALATLDTAVAKMDKETEQRLRITFDEVNTAFQALFPRLFGGGRAMLELTSDNLLEAGVLVMAQPPGKRNSTIHLLSGGEKAMTAVALVFAIFQLNPSPFCMLDEVDAPLDDVNVGRFCDLVKEMSQFVQFLFITHNKVTMELADHLIGITMREPGVSRVVAVDVEEALAMAEL